MLNLTCGHSYGSLRRFFGQLPFGRESGMLTNGCLLPDSGALLQATHRDAGLFAVMTTHRPEIIVEGSQDGRTWRASEFRSVAAGLT